MMVVSVFIANTIAHELYKREQELKITLDKLHQAEKAKQKYTMGVVHEIKTPIVAVQSFLDIVIQKFAGNVSEQAEDKLKKARIRSEEAINTINDVLSISKLKLLDSITPEESKLELLIENVISHFRTNIEYKNIDIKIRDERIPQKSVFADAKLIELAFSNIIGNAVKYTPKNGRIEILVSELNEDNILIEISDSGIGIPEQDINKVFNDFYRSSNAKEIKIEGSGLGLSVVKQIVEQHNGLISAESPSELSDGVNKGTKIKIILPYKAEMSTDKKV